MIQNCEAIIRIYGSENPSTIRDYLKSYFNKVENRKLDNRNKIDDIDIWRDNDDVLIKYITDIECCFYPGCAGTYWDPPEPAYVEGYYTIDDFISMTKEILLRNFPEEDFNFEEDEDSFIPNEEEMIENYWDEWGY